MHKLRLEIWLSKFENLFLGEVNFIANISVLSALFRGVRRDGYNFFSAGKGMSVHLNK